MNLIHKMYVVLEATYRYLKNALSQQLQCSPGNRTFFKAEQWDSLSREIRLELMPDVTEINLWNTLFLCCSHREINYIK